MQKIKSIYHSEAFAEIPLLVLISGLLYLLFVPQFGYFNDDWYLMYAAGAKGASAFKNIYIVDRPMRALVLSPAYLLFGNNPILYNLSAWGWRVISAVIFYYLLKLLWPQQKKVIWTSALLYLIYPGFLSQFNGIDYQSQMVSLAMMMLSLLLLVFAYKSPNLPMRLILFFFIFLTSTLYLGLVEYFIGMEIFKIAFILLLVFRERNGRNWRELAKKATLWISYSLAALLPFLIWRLFFFHSARGATDVNTQLANIRANPILALQGWFFTLFKNIGDVTFFAWISPLLGRIHRIAAGDWILGIALAGLILALVWLEFRKERDLKNEPTDSNWKAEAAWLGWVMLVFGLLPVILVGRYVDFRSFSRYALAPSIGVVLLWQAGLAFIPSVRFRNAVYAIMIVSSSLTHYGNSIIHVNATEEMSQFWWQVSWRIPQLRAETTLLANYPDIAAEEDYFIWGPANLIYYPESMNEKYPQPGIYSLLATDEATVKKIMEGAKKGYSNRRSIRTYPNYGGVLILSQPTSTSCVQVISGGQTEYSSFEDERIVRIGSSSDANFILTEESFRQPPQIPFRLEPEHTWCYYYEKASFARQLNDWDEVLRLANEAFDKGFAPQDEIEWLPFLQAYAVTNDLTRLHEIETKMTDLYILGQACQILGNMSGLSEATYSEIASLFCSK